MAVRDFLRIFVVQKETNMLTSILHIEGWWRHCGAYDRQQASGIPYDGNVMSYLQKTDDWWDELNWEERRAIYEEFFSEY